MSGFTAKKLKEARNNVHLTQAEAARMVNISERKLRSIESDETPLLVEDLLELAKIYRVDVRELLFESYVSDSEEQILCHRYSSILRMIDKLSDKDKEDIIWVMKQRIEGRL